jgi:hypothetical protein
VARSGRAGQSINLDQFFRFGIRLTIVLADGADNLVEKTGFVVSLQGSTSQKDLRPEGQESSAQGLPWEKLALR